MANKNYTDKQFEIPAIYSDLTGKFQKYTITTATKLMAEDGYSAEKAQANLLRVIETLKQAGGQLVISHLAKVSTNYVLEFFCEQKNTFGTAPTTAIPALFAHVTDVDGTAITVTATTEVYDA